MMHHQDNRTGSTVSRIPAFKDRQEEAAWWDSHDVTDYLDELNPTQVNVADGLSEAVTINLDAPAIRSLQVLAREQGLDSTALVTAWVMERLQAETERAAEARPGGEAR